MSKNNFLNVSEKFYSLQGEGQTMGIPAVFVRLGGCNILCKSKDWVCDTIKVWRKSKKVDFENVLSEEEVQRLYEGAHLVMTGGEPLLHQKKLILYFNWFVAKYSFIPIVEVETNGTVMPTGELGKFVSYWNCSPKLSNSGVKFEQRFKPLVIRTLNKLNKVIFKFVISKREDVLELFNEYGAYLDMENVVLMPAGETQEELNKTRPIVVDECKQLGLRYCDRLHIVIWNKKTGV